MSLSRRLVAGAVVVIVSGGALLWQGSHRQVPLYQEAVTRDAYGALVPIAPGRSAEGWLPLSDDSDAMPMEVSLLAAREAGHQAWLASGWTPDPQDRHADMTVAALRDMRILTAPAGSPAGAVLAGASPAWQFFWPRDASFVAVAYARSGHQDEALATLLLLQDLQEPDGSMQARYLPDQSGAVPDDRLPQEDGPGWALWAARDLIEVGMPDAGQPAELVPVPAAELTPLITRSADRLLQRIDPATGLPMPSPDYWERPEDELTLGIAGTSLMGLEAAAALYADGHVSEGDWLGAGVDPTRLQPAAAALRDRIVEDFGPAFPRYVGSAPDAAVTFLLPPFVEVAVPGADAARLRGQWSQMRPAGGLAPGATWRNDGISWTPETALQALAAAHNGHTDEAVMWLDWLDDHRTVAGALPEKVLHNGDPAAVAPLAWTAALVVLTLQP